MSDPTMREATDEDRARLAALADELNPPTTSVSFTLDELTALRGGFVRDNDDDERIYRRLCEAEQRLIIREVMKGKVSK